MDEDQINKGILKQVKFQLDTLLYNFKQIDTSKMSKEQIESYLIRYAIGVESIKSYIERNQKG